MPLHRLLVRRCDLSKEVSPLALAAQGWDEAERPALWRSVRQAALQAPNRWLLLAAERDDSLVAAQIAQVLPGRSALAWPVQWVDQHLPEADPAAALDTLQTFEKELIGGLARVECAFVQALTAPDDTFSAQTLSAEGFKPMTQLVYLVDELDQSRVPRIGNALSWVDFDPEDESRLARVIEWTYVGTRDCPWLDRLRTTADVLAGYRAVGRFDPALWNIARHRGKDVGCVLVNVHPDVQHGELVYLGLVPEARGRGWGRELVDRARRLALRGCCQRMVLAVDDANEPAKRLYAKCGFVEFGRRELWLHTLSR